LVKLSPAWSENLKKPMEITNQNDNEQLWNGVAGRAWVEAQELTDQLFKPVEDFLVETVPAGAGGSLLDVGCGTGSTTVAALRRMGAQGRATGIDISEPMLAAAKMRAEKQGVAASFIRADAQSYQFEPASFDLIISRFGVMFFEDPVQAFANLHCAMTTRGVLGCIAWRSAAENPFMTTAERAAAPVLQLPERRKDGPGQFAFANREKVHGILEQSGWARIDIRPVDVICSMPEREITGYLSRLGAVGRALQESDETTRARVLAVVRPAFDPYVHGEDVRFTAACWMISARV
jgi:ubiquinone/menaquinone biosynthesis C-methylase UbiE